MSLSLDGMPDQLKKHLNKQKECIQGLMELLKESLDDMPAELNQQGELTAGLACSPPRLGRSWEPSPARERSFEVSAWRRALTFFRSLGCRSLVTSSSRPRALLTGHGNSRRRRITYEDER